HPPGPARLVLERLPLHSALLATPRHVQLPGTHVDSHTKPLHRSDLSLLMSIRLPDPVPSRANLVDAGSVCGPRILHGVREEGGKSLSSTSSRLQGLLATFPDRVSYPEARTCQRTRGAILQGILPSGAPHPALRATLSPQAGRGTRRKKKAARRAAFGSSRIQPTGA